MRRTTSEENWYVQESLEKLKEVRDQIVNFWNWQSAMDEPQRNMWIGDVQDIYYQLITAWDLRKQSAKEHSGYYNSVHLTLASAQSRFKQVMSELHSISHKRAAVLAQELQASFEECWKPLAIQAGIEELLSDKKMERPESVVNKIGNTEYQLLCSICGTISYVFKIGTPHHAKDKRLIYKGLTHTGDLDIQYANRVFEWLEQEKIAEIHRFMQKVRTAQGIDAYCPDCDKVYCCGHYFLDEVWDEGFYDCTYGTCPGNHRRMIDD
ncbi:MAG: hypothetical protein KDH97_13375 [Calditrichaeota bacterium]|nr:hypothetical protein [Calditrichota bacterium]MCB0298032.1 hypothetical protein [Calditrichota bacterium]MCB0312390.1 hypothetical protein [Calditrichota bacterium]